MNQPLYDPNGHLQPTIIGQLCQGTASLENRLAALEHLGGCTHCALALSQAMEKRPLLAPSPGFKQNTIEKLHRQRPAPRPQQNGSGFWAYTLRVTAAMCAALILVFSLPEAPAESFSLSVADSITTGIKSISAKLLNLEVIDYD
ncbi:MAG: hypothetical protein GX491_23105 [Chloroflexi bacterium]|nr:hypothetical protein [Chloroflexota bacterium]